MSSDKLGDRIKSQYEDRTRHLVPRRTYTLIRIDGKAFHTFTKGFERPFDKDLMRMMDNTAIQLCSQIQGAKLAFVQSDEISILLTDFEKHTTDAWFDGNIQKMASVSASIATLAFNQELYKLSNETMDGPAKIFKKDGKLKTALFDSRVFTIPDQVEVFNYLVWRQQDATRNSILSAGHANFSTKELHGQNTSKIQDMLMLEKGINWNDYSPREKRGGLITKVSREFRSVTTGTVKINSTTTPDSYTRSSWEAVDCPIFTSDEGREMMAKLIPKMENM